MKNLMVLLLGFGLGIGGTLLWLRKDIQKQIQELENTKNEENVEDNIPFSMKKEVKKNVQKAVEARKTEKTAYHNVPQVESKPQEAEIEPEEEEEIDYGGEFVDETDGGIIEIDVDEMMHNHEYEKERLVYFRGDKIMATESGTIIGNPYILVGGEWESCVGNFADNTAFIRNNKTVTDYEIFVEDGLYADEYGSESGFED